MVILRVTFLEPYGLCLEISEGIVFAGAYISLGAQTTCYNFPYHFPEFAEDLAQRIPEGQRGERAPCVLK